MQAPTEIRQLRRRASLWVEGIYEVSDDSKTFSWKDIWRFCKDCIFFLKGKAIGSQVENLTSASLGNLWNLPGQHLELTSNQTLVLSFRQRLATSVREKIVGAGG